MTSKRNHVLMLVNTYAPDDYRFLAAQSLTEMGYHVYVVGAARQRNERVNVRQNVGGVDVFITPMVASLKPGAVLKALWQLIRCNPGETTLASPYVRTNLLSILFFNLWILRLGIGRKIHVIHSNDLSPMPAAWLLSKLKRAGLIYDVREDAVTMYSGRKGRWVSRLERWLLPRADVVISAGIRLMPELKQRGAREVILIGNWKRLQDFDIAAKRLQAERERLNITDEDFVITYVGTIDPSREIMPLIEAVARAANVKLIIGGRGVLQAEVEQAAKHCANIVWLGWVDVADVALYTNMADVIYHVRTMDRFVEKNAIAPAANKLFEAFAAGKPILATKGVNEVSDILEETGAGVLIESVTPEAILEALHSLKDKQRQEQLRASALKAREQYHWGIAEDRLREIYSRLTGERGL